MSTTITEAQELIDIAEKRIANHIAREVAELENNLDLAIDCVDVDTIRTEMFGVKNFTRLVEVNITVTL